MTAFEEIGELYRKRVLHGMAKSLKCRNEWVDDLVSVVVTCVLEKGEDYLNEIRNRPATNKKYSNLEQYIYGVFKNNLFFVRTPFDKEVKNYQNRKTNINNAPEYKQHKLDRISDKEFINDGN